ncbi:MAG: murein hydrolase activator EnvC [Actinomycetota bacterium]
MASIRTTITVAAATATLWALASSPAPAETSPPAGSWIRPVRGPVIRGFEPPPTPFSPGHRGIDVATPFGTPVRAPADGVVTFAGTVAGAIFVTIDHADGYRSTSSWLAQSLVAKGQSVRAGDVVALSGHGHPEIETAHLHFGVRLGDDYVDPLPLLATESVVDLIRLAPLDEPSPEAVRPSAAHPVLVLAVADPSLAAVKAALLRGEGPFDHRPVPHAATGPPRGPPGDEAPSP